MNKIIEKNQINIYNNKKELIFTIFNNEQNQYFIDNWYFLNTYYNNQRYTGSFNIKYL